MSMKNKEKERLDRILEGIEVASKNEGVTPQELTPTQFFKHVANVTPWDIRVLGGLSGVKKAYFPVQTKDLASIRKEKEIVKYIKKLEDKASATLVLNNEVESMIRDAISSLKITKTKVGEVKVQNGTKMTMELMLSDIHYGKKTSTFNLEVCRQRMTYLTEVFLKELKRKQKEGYNVERVIVALIGDLIESYTMHGLESAAGCEFGNAQQVQAAITSLYHDVLLPIAKTGIKIDVPAVTGNHDRTEHSRTMQEPGVNNLTWIIYKSLEELCQISGFKNVKFQIPTGSYIILDIYNNTVLYEHGDNVKGTTKKSFETLIENRSRQSGISIDFGRFGHWHDYMCFDRGRIIVNESVCGLDSYASVMGFNSKAGQTINFYVDTKNRPNCFYYSFPVDLT